MTVTGNQASGGVAEGSEEWANRVLSVCAGYRSRVDGQEGVNCCQAASLGSAGTGCAEQADSGPGVPWYVTVISSLSRGWHAPFLIRNREKSIRGFLMPRFLNARDQL